MALFAFLPIISLLLSCAALCARARVRVTTLRDFEAFVMRLSSFFAFVHTLHRVAYYVKEKMASKKVILSYLAKTLGDEEEGFFFLLFPQLYSLVPCA